jgi:hypothetical protein
MDTPEVHLTGLTPATNYSLLVTAVFVSNRNMTSETFAFSTVGTEGLPRKFMGATRPPGRRNSAFPKFARAEFPFSENLTSKLFFPCIKFATAITLHIGMQSVVC